MFNCSKGFTKINKIPMILIFNFRENFETGTIFSLKPRQVLFSSTKFLGRVDLAE